MAETSSFQTKEWDTSKFPIDTIATMVGMALIETGFPGLAQFVSVKDDNVWVVGPRGSRFDAEAEKAIYEAFRIVKTRVGGTSTQMPCYACFKTLPKEGERITCTHGLGALWTP